MLLDIPDIDAPVFMATTGAKRHLQFGAISALRGREAIELTVRRHDAATGRWTDIDSHAQERGMDAKFPQQGILLKFADLVSDCQGRLAWPAPSLGLLL